MDAQQYEALPDDLTLWCVYCGHHAEHSEFVTAGAEPPAGPTARRVRK
jgi:hypothetical protein